MSQSTQQFDIMREYINHNPIATVGTLNLDGSPHGSAVYVCADEKRRVVYFLTKSETTKRTNLKKHDKVSLTIVNPKENSTLQASGKATIITDPELGTAVINRIEMLHDNAVDWVPPLSKLNAGAYVLVAVEIWNARLAHFQGMEVGNEQIFTQA